MTKDALYKLAETFADDITSVKYKVNGVYYTEESILVSGPFDGFSRIYIYFTIPVGLIGDVTNIRVEGTTFTWDFSDVTFEKTKEKVKVNLNYNVIVGG